MLQKCKALLYILIMRTKRVPRPVMIRMPDDLKTDCAQIAVANDLTLSDIIRIAVRLQLPELKAGRLKLTPLKQIK